MLARFGSQGHLNDIVYACWDTQERRFMNKSEVRLCVKAEAVKTINRSDKNTEVNSQAVKAINSKVATLTVNIMKKSRFSA